VTTSGLTNTELRATAVPVSIAATLTVSGSVSVSNLPATQAVSVAALPLPSGAATEATLAALSAKLPSVLLSDRLKVDGSGVTQPVSGTFWQATQPVSIAAMPSTPVTGTFWQATQPVSGTVTVNAGTNLNTSALALDATLTGGTQKSKLVDTGGTNVASISAAGALKVDGSAVTQPVSGTFWQATQPVSGTFFQATQPVSIAAMPTTPVTGTFFQATQPVSGTVTANAGSGTFTVSGTVTANAGTGTLATSLASLPALTVAAAASSSPVGSVSLGNNLGKTNQLKTGTLVTTAVTADQTVLTFTVTAGKVFYLQYVTVMARLTTFATTATFFGTCSLETPSGTKVLTYGPSGPGITDQFTVNFEEPIPIAAGVVVRLVCTPSAVTSFTWYGNFGGYEK
jgi:hypothetical protein